MGKSLVIVESPAKAKTINKYLGTAFVVKSSVGHIRDLPVSGSGDAKEKPRKAVKKADATDKAVRARQQLFARMGVNPEQGWEAHYQILPGKEKVVAELRKFAADADHIFLATDLDREGEAIAWHLAETIGGAPEKYRRVVFNEITKKAIQEAFDRPGALDLDRVNAQQARRFLDRVVGYMVSPLLWAKIARGLSAGRVQSVAVKLIVEREREIRAFVPEEYWEVFADLNGKAGQARFMVARHVGEAFRPVTESQTQQHLVALKGGQYRVDKREDKPTRSRPSAPFITSTLQQAASSRLGFSVKKTMTLAQRLYEAGHITYMRTDSTNLSAEAVESARALIGKEFGKRYLPDSPRMYSSKEGAQEAHEAIRPSDVTRRADDLDVERDAQRLYELIWRQFVACQMADAEFLSSGLSVVTGDYELRARGRIVEFDGFLKVLPSAKSDDDVVLPDLKVGDMLTLQTLDPKQHFTKPTPRYSEATLVRELEKRGIGRPSTYAAIISTIQERGYVRLENRRFYAEKMGDIVTERLGESFPDLMDFGFTAKLEEELDEIATGKSHWKAVLDRFYEGFAKRLKSAESATGGGMRENQPTMTSISCPTCGRPMQIRTASTGVFLGCSGYALPPKERCKTTINLVSADEFAALDEDDEGESRRLRLKRRCELCGTAMDSYVLDERRKIHVCGNNPDCAGYALEEGIFKLKGYEGPSLECDKCGSQMQLKTGRFGKFFGCTNASCKNTRKLLRSGEAAPPKIEPVAMPELKCEKVNDHYVLRDGAAGLFLAASQFPRNRETRAPLLRELVPHKSAIDPKYHYLFDGPQADPQGNPSIIRFSRKSKEHYLTTESGGKTTGWTAHFVDGKWVASS